MRKRVMVAVAIAALVAPLPGAGPAGASGPAASVSAWGNNDFGQLGDGTTSDRIPVPTRGLTDVTALSAGARHSLALRSDGTVWAWGSDSATPVHVRGLTGVTAVAGGNNHGLALRTTTPCGRGD